MIREPEGDLELLPLLASATFLIINPWTGMGQGFDRFCRPEYSDCDIQNSTRRDLNEQHNADSRVNSDLVSV